MNQKQFQKGQFHCNRPSCLKLQTHQNCYAMIDNVSETSYYEHKKLETVEVTGCCYHDLVNLLGDDLVLVKEGRRSEGKHVEEDMTHTCALVIHFLPLFSFFPLPTVTLSPITRTLFQITIF